MRVDTYALMGRDRIGNSLIRINSGKSGGRTKCIEFNRGRPMKILKVFAAAVLLASASTAVLAQDDTDGVAGHWQVRLRGVAVLPDASATVKVGGVDIGGSTHVTKSFIPEVDGTYFLTDHIGVEVIAGTTKHAIHQSIAGPVASVWLLPPTVTAQYHFDPEGAIRPYIGAGVNYTIFYSAQGNGIITSPSFKNNFGWALQAGVDVPVGDGPYFVNLDVKKLFLSTDMKANGGAVRASADLNPWLIGTGVGIRF
jgi:outer membrane protein